MKSTHPSGAHHWTRRKPELIKRGVDSHAAKLSAEQIVALRALYSCGASKTWLAKKYGVSRITIWRHIKDM